MKKRMGFYVSGSASRIFSFYQKYSVSDYPFVFIFYDGENDQVEQRLIETFGNKVFIFKNAEKLTGKKLSDSISKILYNKFIEFKADYLFVFGDKILKPILVDNFKNRIINFHPSILPAFPGLNAIDQALMSSVQILGNTAHFIDNDIDTGPIIMQSVISRRAYKNYEDVLGLQIPMLKKIWLLLEEDKITVENNKVVIDTKEEEQVKFFSI